MSDKINNGIHNEDILEGLLEASPDALVISNVDGTIALVNAQAEKLFGYGKEELIGKPIEVLLPQRLRDGHVHHRRDYYESPHFREMGSDLSLFTLHKDGREIPVEVSLAPFRTKAGLVVISAVRDVSARKAAEEKLKEMQARLFQADKLATIGQIATSIAHDIKSPLGYIHSNLETLTDYLTTYAKVVLFSSELRANIEAQNLDLAKDVMNKMAALEKKVDLNYLVNDTESLMKETQQGLDRINHIAQNLKNYSRMDRDAPADVNIEDVLNEVLSIVWSEIKYKAAVKKEYGAAATVKGHAQELGQVFMNLLLNAAQSMEGKGEIRVRTYANDGNVCVDISDTGKGIAAEDIKSIFDSFYTTKPAGVGTGLGLSIVKDIIKNHGGDITVASELGKGTIFTVIVPVEYRGRE